MDAERLEARLRETFDAGDDECRVVVRGARDLADAGRYAETHDGELGVDLVIDNLAEAPDDFGLVERWNWWVGAMELAHGGYDQFRIRRWEAN